MIPEKKPEQKIEKKDLEPKIQIDDQTTQDNFNYDLKGCKICFNGQSSMINNKCRHLMICEQCFKQMKARHSNKGDTMPCPYCATVGKYTKFIEPIYI